ncbi:MAG TPA: porin family protein [Edaphocola sp.]|nr:porin family protein [Edaphocola sp.]
MKRIILGACALFGLSATAQAQMSIGIEAGATYNTLTQVINGVDRDTEGQVGARGGIIFNIPLGESSRFHLQPSLIYDAGSGSKSDYSSQTATGSGVPVYERDMRHYRINQVNLPIYLVYKFGDPIYDENHFFIGLGPSFSYTVGGRLHQIYSNWFNGRERTKDNDLPINVGEGTYKDYKEFNVGASVTLGYEFKPGIYVKGHYTYNFLNMHPLASSKNEMQAMQAGLTVGFFFKKFERYKY